MIGRMCGTRWGLDGIGGGLGGRGKMGREWNEEGGCGVK